MTNTVLVVGDPFEAGTDLVVEGLSSSDIPVFRMDTADFPRELELRATNVDGQWAGTLSNKYRSIALADVKAVYWNRPNLFQFPELSESYAHWARGAARIGLGGVLMSLAARWMNHPSRASVAEFKPQQLRTARSMGLATPRTLITNSADEVRAFAENVEVPLITKPLGAPHVVHSRGSETMYTREVDLDALGGVELTAHLFRAGTWLDWPSPTLRWTSSCSRMVGGPSWRQTPRASGHGSTVRKSPWPLPSLTPWRTGAAGELETAR
ncbi:MvdC/MvdD family ATP grasp protein [Streptomyces antimycoticus]|uniref:MvdC/MvdD family ATP grasp protein n=1 Tax=Streptomyces antimycoticus TaxID=68175 RepID=UPI001F42B9D8|nr:hypothetical protein [Streptomyces antimycoticus]